MSETTTSHIMPTMKQMWAQGGIKTFYRGLIVSLFDLSGRIIAHLYVQIGLVGVFPYSG